MIDFNQHRGKNDIFSMPFLGFIFKNTKFILFVRLFVLALFVYGVYLGYTVPEKENTFTKELFWGLFWSLFMVTTLATFGRIFCGICPHGFIGKYLTRYGLQKEMPSWLKNPWWGLMLLIIGWWAVSYTFPGFYRLPLVTAILFTALSLIAFVLYFLYKDMSYCKYVCPIGSVTKAYQRVSFTWLGSYKSDCSECKTFDCAKACPYNLKPFTFNNKNSMEDCSLCMECAESCEAIHFNIVPPARSLYSKLKNQKIEVWVFILITAAISVTMTFHHGLGRSGIAESLPWVMNAATLKQYIHLNGFDATGFFAFIYANIITLFLVTAGFYLASKVLRESFEKTFYTLGYALAPIFLIGGLSHLSQSFLTHEYADIVNGFIYGFNLPFEHVQNLASRRDKWLIALEFFKYASILWAFFILYKRVNLFKGSKKTKALAFSFASLFLVFFLSINLLRIYIAKTHPVQRHHAHMQHHTHKM